jgi:hypothetical protein
MPYPCLRWSSSREVNSPVLPLPPPASHTGPPPAGLCAASPMLFACFAGTSDVIAAVKFATAKGLSLSVKGGGHGAVSESPR